MVLFGKNESTWEPLETVLKGAPIAGCNSEMRKLELSRKTWASLHSDEARHQALGADFLAMPVAAA